MLQKEKSAQSRARILDAAIRVFNEKTYEKASVSAICREGAVAKGQMYYYFENKEDLYVSAAQHIYEALARVLLQFQPNPAVDIESNLMTFFDMWQLHWEGHMEHAKFIARAKYNAPRDLHPQALAMRQKAIETRLKPTLRTIFNLYFSNDGEQCRIMTDFAWFVLEYVAADVGFTKLNARLPMDSSFFQVQRDLFHGILKAMLYGCLPPEFRPAEK